ncbi:MAG TPA: response regulator [Holophaga sp.]|nr:response regulator [Holophaga sp.]
MTDLYAPTPERPGRILIVDDLLGNLKVHARELRHEPFELVMAQSAAEALEACAGQVFEGILMDVSLPGMDGIEACRRIRETPLNAATPLIFISAVRIGEDWVRSGIDSGGIDYLAKPYVFSELLVKLRMMVRLSRQREAALAGERHRTLLEVAGGAAHELSQPLAAAQLLLDRLINAPAPPSARDLEELRSCLGETARVLRQIQNLHTVITKPYASGRILDLELSSRPPFMD